ncbi:MAG: precorrin-4 C(11)-methyltransferase [Nitrospinae bacterium]|nr:precorrin-4 C(11)-methyltransferase [Nitrospinota bacterium]
MKVYFVGAGPGDPKLLTIRAKELLESCACCVYAGSLVSPEVISLIPKSAEKYDSAKMELSEIVAVFKKAMEKNIDVVRLHTGDPSIFGAIREQMNELDALGVAYETIPGVSSFQAASAALNLELTVPEKAQAVILGRTGGRTPVPPEQDLDMLGRTKATLCLFLSVQNLRESAKKLSNHHGSDCPVAVVSKASWPDQRIITGTLADITDKTESAGIDKTAIVIVGEALRRNHAASRLYAGDFSHGFRKAGE